MPVRSDRFRQFTNRRVWRTIIGMARMATTIWLAVCLIGSGGCGMKGNQPSSGQADSALPNPYRPDRSNDPHARKTWEDGVTALEAECRRSGRYCEDAKASRAALRKGQP